MVRLHRYRNFVDHRRDFGCCLPARLTGFAGNDAGQLGFIGLQQRSKFLNQRPALEEWPFRPRRKRAACSLTGLLNLPGACVVPRPEHLRPTGLVFVRASPSPVTQSPLIHRVMLFSPQGRAAPGEPCRQRYISGHPVAQPSVPDARMMGWFAPAWRGSWCNSRSRPQAGHSPGAGWPSETSTGGFTDGANAVNVAFQRRAAVEDVDVVTVAKSLFSSTARAGAVCGELRRSPPALLALGNGYK